MDEPITETSLPPEQNDNKPAENQGSRLGSIIGILILASVLIFGAIFLARNFINAATSPIAKVMPANTTLFFEINGLNLTSDHAVQMTKAFENAFAESGLEVDPQNPQSFLDEIDQDLAAEFGLTIREDVLPWIGKNIGLGFSELDYVALDQGQMPNWVLAANVRDTAAADEFITKFSETIKEKSNNELGIIASDYEGVTTYEIESPREDEQWAFARSGDIFLVAANQTMLKASIDTQRGDSLADSVIYKDTVSQLPEERIFTFFADGTQFNEFYTDIFENDPGLMALNSDFLTQNSFTAVAATISIIEEGIKLDSFTTYNELSETQKAIFEAQMNQIETAQILPENTYVHIASHGLNLSWALIKESFISADLTEADFEESMTFFADTFGFNPDTDLLPKLDGEYALALIASNEGTMPQELEVNLGALALLGHHSREDLTGVLQRFSDSLTEQGLEIVTSEENELTLHTVGGFSDTEMAAYAINDEYIILSTSDEDLINLFAGGNSLADSEAYQKVWAAFPENTIPVLYINWGGLLDEVKHMDPEIEAFADLYPITAVALGTKTNEKTLHTTAIIFVEQAAE